MYLEFDDANFKVNLYSRYHFQKNSEGNPIIDAQYTTWISSGVNAKYKAMLLQQMKSKFVAKYDMDGKTSMEWRQLWWEQGAKAQWTFAFYHDIQYPTFTPAPVL